MKYFKLLVVIMVALTIALANAYAADQLIERKISKILFKKDKNGAEYARIIVPEPKTLNGVAYNKDVSVMVFGDQVKNVKALKQGDTLKGVVSTSEFRGGISYQLLSLTK